MSKPDKWKLEKTRGHSHPFCLKSPHSIKSILLTVEDVSQLREVFSLDMRLRVEQAKAAIMEVRGRQSKVEYPLISYGAMGLLDFVESGDPEMIRAPELRDALDKEMLKVV